MKASSGQDRHLCRLEHEGTLVDVARQEGLVLDPVAAGALDHDRVFKDTFEAIVGAVCLDQGLHAAKRFVSYQYDTNIDPETVRIRTRITRIH